MGGYPGDDEKGLALFQQLDRGKMTEDFLAAARWLKSRPDTTGELGAAGFCFGGGVVNQLRSCNGFFAEGSLRPFTTAIATRLCLGPA